MDVRVKQHLGLYDRNGNITKQKFIKFFPYLSMSQGLGVCIIPHDVKPFVLSLFVKGVDLCVNQRRFVT